MGDHVAQGERPQGQMSFVRGLARQSGGQDRLQVIAGRRHWHARRLAAGAKRDDGAAMRAERDPGRGTTVQASSDVRGGIGLGAVAS
jgi:hypothetical protein